jgi:hypothetical protein
MRRFGVTWPSGDAKGHRPIVHPTALPSKDDGWPLEAVAWQVGWLPWSEWWFGGRFGPQVTDSGPVNLWQLNLHLGSTLEK